MMLMPQMMGGAQVVEGGGDSWWLSGGIDANDCLAAYQPKGAASLDASYLNLAVPGANDCTPSGGIWATPTLNDDGWVFYRARLTTGINTGPSISMIVRVTNASLDSTAQSNITCGNWSTSRFYIAAFRSSGTDRIYGYGGSTIVKAGAVTSGVLALCGSTAYLNGAVDAPNVGTWVSYSVPILIGGSDRSGIIDTAFKGTVVAMTIYGRVLTALEVAAVTDAIELL